MPREAIGEACSSRGARAPRALAPGAAAPHACRVLRCGTSSWTEKSWNGVFYPDGLPAADQLGFYAQHFAAVEVDATYYAIPQARVVDGWAARTPPGFVLCAKFPRSVVHGGEHAKPDGARALVPDVVAAEVQEFVTVMQRLGDKLGPLVIQLPFFDQHAFPSAAAFLQRLDAFLAMLPRGPRYAVEVRNKYWLARPLCDLLRRHAAALVLVDLAYMPHPADVARRLDVVTTDFTYARLIGDRKAMDALTDRFDHVVVDQSRRLARWAELLRRLAPRVRDTYVFANNHYAGFAPATIRSLIAAVRDRTDSDTAQTPPHG